MKEIIEENEYNVIYHHTGKSKFTGCQCFKDCSCSEDFIPGNYDFYTVKRKGKKTTNHYSLEEAKKRFDFVNKLNNL